MIIHPLPTAFTLAALMLLSGCALLFPGEPVLVLEDLAAGADPSRLKARTPEPRRFAIAYQVDERHYRGDLYRPGEPPLAGLVLVPGVAEAGRNDPRIIAIAKTLARARFLVLVPDLVGLRMFRLDTDNVQGIADAAAYLIEHRQAADLPRIGIMAVSYAVGPAVLAALRPGIAGGLDFVLGLGGYYDLTHVLTFAITGCAHVEGRWRCREPHPYGRWVFLRNNLHRLSDSRDRALLRAIAERRLADPDTPVAALAEKLGAEGQAVYALLTNTDPRRVPELMRALPTPARADFRALTLDNKDFSRLHARLILVHGKDDRIIPPVESVKLAAAVPPEKVELFLVAGLAHVDVAPEKLDRFALIAAMRALLAERAPAGSTILERTPATE